MRIALLHYASPPVVGGVESTIAYHARGLTEQGYTVRVVSGQGGTFDERVETYVQPLFGSRQPDVAAVKQELDRGVVSAAFEHLVARQQAALREALAGCSVCIVHNVLSLNKNLALTAALARLEAPALIAWCHDLAWTNPQYLPELHEGYPWNLLRQAWPRTRYVTVSEMRRAELAGLLDVAHDQIEVIAPGIDPARFFQWTPTMRQIERHLGLLDADGLLLLPARLTRRKNISLALRVLHAVRRLSQQDLRLVVTGPPGPHNPTNSAYLKELLDLRHSLALDHAAHFLYELTPSPLIPDDDTVANLYQLADALFFPSAQEGFGIPLLEAGLAGLPIFCSDIEPFHQTGGTDVIYFDPDKTPVDIIAAQILDHFRDSARFRLRRRVRREYRWESLIRRQLIPLIESL